MTVYQIILLGFALYVILRILRSRYRHDRLGHELKQTPDLPLSFGKNTGWIAIKTRNTRKVANAIGLRKRETANWWSGLAVAQDPHKGANKVFVTPPLDDWTFIVGSAIPFPAGANQSDSCTPILTNLGSKFSEVQYFFADEELGFFAWARLKNGKIGRAFAWGDEGIIWNRGRATKEERALGLRPLEPQTAKLQDRDSALQRLVYPSEDHVHRLAGAWSISPMDIKFLETSEGVGIVGTTSPSWRKH